jgi:hypothetical protein
MSWTCPKCDRELLRENYPHYCIKVSLDTLFEGTDAELILVFDKILAEVADWNGVIISTSKNCIVFVHRQTFLVIRPMKKMLDVKFYSAELLHDGLFSKSVFYSGKYEHHVRLSKTEQLTPALFNYMLQSYRLL